MTVTIKLFATLRDGRFEIEERVFDNDATVQDVVNALDIPESEVALILVNGRHTDIDHALQAGDTLALFPPVGGG